jgi:nucleotide-binding universal stress UspA family protein
MKVSKTQTKAKPVLVWAIDPLEREARPSRASFAALSRWAKTMGWEIQPVSVATPTMKDLERGLLGSVNHVQSALDAYLKLYPKVRRGRVLVNEHSSQGGAVSKLLRYAKQECAAAVAVSSHGRSGLDRLVLGSFAETLLETSPLPVFFLNHGAPKAEKRRNVVLFPTNFSADSRAVYQEFLQAASGTKLEVVLFHGISYPLQLDTGMGTYLPDGYMEDQKNWADSEGRRWVEDAKKRNVKAKFLLHAAGIGFMNGETVLEAAKEVGASAVVMNTTGSAVGRMLIGSVAYPVFRSNKVLTLMFGPKARALKHGEADSFPVARAEA